MRAWFAFRLVDGALTGQRLDTNSIEDRDRQTPAGCGWVAWVTHPRAQRVHKLLMDDFGTACVPQLEDWIPPAPDATVGVEWTWDEISREWLSTETLDGVKGRLRTQAIAKLDELDLQLARPTAEALQAMLIDEAPPAAAVDKIHEVSAAKAAIRQLMQEISAASTAEELETLKGGL